MLLRVELVCWHRPVQFSQEPRAVPRAKPITAAVIAQQLPRMGLVHLLFWVALVAWFQAVEQ